LAEETIEDISSWLYKDKEPVTIPIKQYGNGLRIVKNMGYKGKGGLGKNNQGEMEPIIVKKKLDKKGLGFGRKVPRALDIEGILDEVAQTSLADLTSKEAIINDSYLHMTNIITESSIVMLSFVSLTSTTNTQIVTLVYPELIDWDQQGALVLDVFQNDEAIAEFMGLQDGIPLGDHKSGFVMQLEQTAYFGENAKSSNRKSNNKERSLGENHTVAPLDHKIVKTKDISKGENLIVAHEDGGFDLPLPSKYQEKSALLVEDSTKINLGIKQNLKTTFVAASLLEQEHKNITNFLQ